MSGQLSSSIINLLKDMAGGKLTEAWASVTKSAIAEAILGLTKLPENLRTPTECIKTSTVHMLKKIHNKGSRYVMMDIYTVLYVVIGMVIYAIYFH